MPNTCEYILGIDYSKKSDLVEYCGVNTPNGYNIHSERIAEIDGQLVTDPIAFSGYYCDYHIRQIGRELGAGYRIQLRKSDAE